MLKGKNVFITGSTRGIGRSTAFVCAANGASLVLHGRDLSVLEQLKEEITGKYHVDVHLLVYDVCETDEIKNAFVWIKRNLGRLDVLVNNAGILEGALLGMVNDKQMSSTFSVNIEAVIYHMQFASRLMSKQKEGSIINLSSVIGRSGNIGQTVYAASKAAVIGATYSAAKELGRHNIRVNAVAPGIINTDMTKQLTEEQYAESLASIRMNRIGTPEEVANTILFLASDLSSYVTGQVIGVDGGMVI